MPNFNIETDSLVTIHKQLKDAYGAWISRADVLEVLRARVKLDCLTKYRRATNSLTTALDWRAVHQLGKEYAVALARKDADWLLEAQRGELPIYAHLITADNRLKMRDAILKLTGDDGAPLIIHCPCCDKLASASTIVTGYGGQQFCRVCVRNGSARWSDLMGMYFNRSYAVNAYPTQDAVEDDLPVLVDSRWAHANGYTRRNQVYFAPGVRAIQNEELLRIFGYHDGPDLGHIPSAYDTRKPRVLLGMELEVENSTYDGDEDNPEVDNSDIARSILRKLNETVPGFAKAERDGSLDCGFELITGYTGLDMHEKAWAQLSSTRYFDYLRSHDTRTCGLHVHVDKAGMTALHAAKLATFINSRDNKPLMTCIARRYQSSGGGGYATFNHEKDFMRAAADAAGSAHRHWRQYRSKGEKFPVQAYLNSEFHHERYSALNFQNEHTVEFRMFRGTTKFETIMACLEFAFASWHFSKQAKMSDLSTRAFMEFICRPENRKDTKHLRKYLKAKKFRQFYQAERIARPKFKEAEPTARAEEMLLMDDVAVI